MTFPRVVLIACAVLALVDGALWEAAGIAAFVVVLVLFFPDGVSPRPWPLRVWWWGGGWRR